MKMRTIYHPLFANVSYKEAEDRLTREEKGAGEVLFRPSSKVRRALSIQALDYLGPYLGPYPGPHLALN
jgi:hypothetical protein